jgi:hypothetical protein
LTFGSVHVDRRRAEATQRADRGLDGGGDIRVDASAEIFRRQPDAQSCQRLVAASFHE